MLRSLCREPHITVNGIYKRFFLPQRFFIMYLVFSFSKNPGNVGPDYGRGAISTSSGIYSEPAPINKQDFLCAHNLPAQHADRVGSLDP